MSTWAEQRKGLITRALPIVPVSSILCPIPTDSDYLGSPGESSLERARTILFQHNQHVALVDQPGSEEQWRLSLQVIAVSKEINEIVYKASKDVDDKMTELQAAVSRLSDSIPLGGCILKGGQWGGKFVAVHTGCHVS